MRLRKRMVAPRIVITVAMLAALGGIALSRAGQVRAEVAERDRVLRLQGIRELGRGLLRPDRRSA